MKLFREKWPRRLLFGIIGLAMFSALLLAIFAPQVIVLMREGFPDPEWPASGRFAEVPGVAQAAEPEGGEDASEAVLKSFEATEGRALLIERGGEVMVEHYGQGVTRDRRLNSYSMVKSLVGALVLRAVADDRIANLDEPLSIYLGEDAPDISIRGTLTMTSGLKLGTVPEKTMEDGRFSPFGGLARLHAFGLDRIMPKLRPDPEWRGKFRYDSVNTALLGRVVETAYGQPLPEILSQLIWQPAGAQAAMWRVYPKGDGVSAYCCLYARPLDWVLVGRFLLDNGSTEEPFLPEPLWRDFIAPELDDAARRAGVYGFQVRHDILDRDGEVLQGPFSYFFGHHGQLVYFLPMRDSIVVRFGGQPQLLHSTLYDLFPS